jgi:hypothetical protein
LLAESGRRPVIIDSYSGSFKADLRQQWSTRLSYRLLSRSNTPVCNSKIEVCGDSLLHGTLQGQSSRYPFFLLV